MLSEVRMNFAWDGGLKAAWQWLSLLCLLISHAGAMNCPKGYTLKEKTSSPNGRYGIFVLSREMAIGLADDDPRLKTSYLAEVKSRKVLSPLETGYHDGGNYKWMEVAWSDDSSWLILSCGVRWWHDHDDLLQIQDCKVTSSDLRKKMAEEIPAQSENWGYPSVAAGTKGNILNLTLEADDNPKAFDDQETHRTYFSGFYDMAAHRWLSAKSEPISKGEFEITSYKGRLRDESQEEWHKRMDVLLNRVYADLKNREKPETFAKLRDEQREWLKGSGKAGSLAKENARLNARLNQLRCMLDDLMAGNSEPGR